MKEDFLKFMELVKTDESVRNKLEEAVKNYSGDQTEEAAFQAVVAPIAKEAGYDFTIEDIKASVKELDPDEMQQVAGGWGLGGFCGIIGGGLGGAASKKEGLGICIVVGAGFFGIS